jgi:hypothetical protein
MKIKENVRFVSSIGYSENLWTYQGFFVVAFKFYTFGSWFNYNHWVGICYFIPLVLISFMNVGSGFSIKNLNFNFLGENIPILFVGSRSVSVDVRIIWYQTQVLKSGFLSFYLLFLVIILSCSVCVHCSC